MKIFFVQRYFFCLWVVLGLAGGMGSGCGLFPVRPEVTSWDTKNKIYLTVPESLETPAWMETFIWTVQCESTKRRTCVGSPVLSLPPDKTLCRYDYQILQGPEGYTGQVILVENNSSLKVHIRAVSGPIRNPGQSKIVLRIRAVGIAKEADEETRKILNCQPFNFQTCESVFSLCFVKGFFGMSED